MIPRRVIIDHGLDVMECLLLRHLGEDAIHAVNFIHHNGKRLNQLQQQVETLQAEKNTISKKFGKTDPADRPVLVVRSKEVGAELAGLEADRDRLKVEIAALELIIPNIPAADSPLPTTRDGFHDDGTPRYKEHPDAAWKRILLQRVHRLIDEENS